MMMLVGAGIAQAEELPGATEWRVLGPAFSRHLSLDGAAITQEASRPGVPEIKKWNENNPAFGLMRSTRDQNGNAEKYFGQVVKDSYGKMGLMLGKAYSWHVYGEESIRIELGYAAGVWYRSYAVTKKDTAWHTTIIPPSQPGGFNTLDATQLNYERTEIKRAWIPFVLPVATFEHKPSGIGLNLSFIPKFKIAGRQISPVNAILFQTTYRF